MTQVQTEQEIQTLRYAFIYQDYPPKDVEQTISNYQQCEGNEENKQAENRSESIVVPYIRGISEKLRRDLAKQAVNVVFKKGKMLHSMIFNGKFKKKIMASSGILETQGTILLGKMFNF